MLPPSVEENLKVLYGQEMIAAVNLSVIYLN